MTVMDSSPVGSPFPPPQSVATNSIAAVVPALSRDQILAVTSVCLREHGYDGTTIRRIAAMLSCAVGSIYRYYRDKHELLFSVTQALFEPVAKQIEAGASVEQGVRGYAQAAHAEPEAYRLLFWLACQGAEASGSPPQPPVIQRMLDMWAQRLGDATVARRVWAMLHGCLMAGEDVETCWMAAAEVICAHRRPEPAAPAIPGRPGHIPRIVTVLTEPPLPPGRLSQVTTVSRPPAAVSEDVTLL
jgi:AcrR family transcriptional regulator